MQDEGEGSREWEQEGVGHVTARRVEKSQTRRKWQSTEIHHLFLAINEMSAMTQRLHPASSIQHPASFSSALHILSVIPPSHPLTPFNPYSQA